jgi:hypothetical protein
VGKRRLRGGSVGLFVDSLLLSSMVGLIWCLVP